MKRVAAMIVASLALAACHHNERLADAAAEGNAAAQYEYGRRLLGGEKGLSANPHQAALWLTAASLRGHAKAQSLLGWCYAVGRGVEKSPEESRRWYEASARQGSAVACLELAKSGLREHREPDAAHWLQPLAEAGFPGPQNILGKLLLLDKGGAIPQAEAQRYLRFAAMNGDAEACLLMSYCYAKGIGVPRNTTLMNSWLRLAAQHGDPTAAGIVTPPRGGGSELK